MKRIFNTCVLFLLTVLVAFSQQPDLTKLDVYLAKTATDWGTPGISVGIVKDGKIIFAKGYGVLETGKPSVPDGNTLYAIASNTKAFTTAMIAMLVQEGKINWDDKVNWKIIWDRKQAWFSFGTVKFNMTNNLSITGMDFDVPNNDIFFEELKPRKVQ